MIANFVVCLDWINQVKWFERFHADFSGIATGFICCAITYLITRFYVFLCLLKGANMSIN